MKCTLSIELHDEGNRTHLVEVRVNAKLAKVLEGCSPKLLKGLFYALLKPLIRRFK